MSFYVKKLYDNELGYRKGIPNKAGKFLLVSKKRADFFPPHKTDEIDPSMSLGIIIDEMKHLVHAEYTHDNDPESGHRGNDRRIYLNEEIDPNGEFFKPGYILYFLDLLTQKIKRQNIFYTDSLLIINNMIYLRK